MGDNRGVNGGVANFKSEYFIVFLPREGGASFGLGMFGFETRLVSLSLLTKAATPAGAVGSFGSGCLYWQNQQGIGHCAGGGGWVCLVRN